MAARANTLVPPDNKHKWNPFMDNLDAYLIAERTSGPKKLDLLKKTKTNVSLQQIYQEWVPMIQNYLVDDPSKTIWPQPFPNTVFPHEELERLLQKLLQIERDILSPPWYNHPPSSYPPWPRQSTTHDPPPLKDGNNEHRSAFANYVMQEKYCSVDFEQLWNNNQEWRTVLQQAMQTTTTITKNQ
jgi:hypothetical protein